MARPGHYMQSGDAAVTPVGDRIVLYHRLTRTAVVLNPSGGALWTHLASPRTISELIAGLQSRFPALATDVAARDVDAFLDELVHHALVTHRP